MQFKTKSCYVSTNKHDLRHLLDSKPITNKKKNHFIYNVYIFLGCFPNNSLLCLELFLQMLFRKDISNPLATTKHDCHCNNNQLTVRLYVRSLAAAGNRFVGEANGECSP